MGGGAIADIQITEHAETEGIADKAISDLPAAIVAAQSLKVDAVSGATNSCNGIVEAVTAALTVAGADLAAFQGEVAAALLENGPLKVGEIGAQVGIANPQYFGSLFKKQMGVTPQEYRRDYRAQQGGEGE